MTQQTRTFLLRGGMNVAAPAIAVPEGQVIGAENYEATIRGYERAGQYERYDGRAKPSDARYYLLNFDQGSAAIAEDEIVTGATSGASGTVLFDAVVSTGAYGTSDAAGYLVLTDVSGSFQDNEDLQVASSTRSTANGTAQLYGALNDDDDRTWLQAAVEKRRAVIAQVPGSGPVRGVCALGGALYAFRDNADATAGVMHKATATGWREQDLGHIVEFDTGTAAFVVGETLTGGTSSATAIIRRVVVLSSVWGDGDASGFLVVSDIVGTFQAAELITGGTSSGSATASGPEFANALPAGGHYDFKLHNFYGAVFSERMYGCNGVGRAFEWDGTYFSPIRTGLSEELDKPKRISEFSNHLFLWFDGGEISNSEIGEPLQYQTIGGAGSFSFGSDPADMLDPTSTALVLIGRSKIGYITGTDTTTFVLEYVTEDAGGQEWTGQVAGNPVYMDDIGVRDLATTQAFGNWKMGTLTMAVEPLFRDYRETGLTPVASVRVRSRDVYRLFFSDGGYFSVYFGRDNPEIMPLRMPTPVFCARPGVVNPDGSESVFVGTSDGWVYELDVGTSFDGAEIEAHVRLAFNNIGSPTRQKRFHKVTLECDAAVNTALAVVADAAYGDPDIPAVVEQDFVVSGGGGFWDTSNWNQFYWSAQVAGTAEAHINAIGQNLSVAVLSKTATEKPHVLSAMALNFSQRRLIR